MREQRPWLCCYMNDDCTANCIFSNLAKCRGNWVYGCFVALECDIGRSIVIDDMYIIINWWSYWKTWQYLYVFTTFSFQTNMMMNVTVHIKHFFLSLGLCRFERKVDAFQSRCGQNLVGYELITVQTHVLMTVSIGCNFII